MLLEKRSEEKEVQKSGKEKRRRDQSNYRAIIIYKISQYIGGK